MIALWYIWVHRRPNASKHGEETAIDDAPHRPAIPEIVASIGYIERESGGVLRRNRRGINIMSKKKGDKGCHQIKCGCRYTKHRPSVGFIFIL
jgi:hypothetical protein